MNLNFSDIFRNFGRICGFRPFKSFGHLIIRPDFFRPLFLRPFVLRPLASLPLRPESQFSARPKLQASKSYKRNTAKKSVFSYFTPLKMTKLTKENI
jgi:hypothetical protein